MYKTKPRFPCSMPSDAPLNVLALNASLKHEPALSNTGELAALVLDEIRALAPIKAESVRHATGRSAIKGKVAGIVITGSEDGALSVMGRIMMVLSWMGFTLPPECAAYWVGEVGQPTSQDREKRLRNGATMHMAKGLAQNLVYYARLLKAHPQTSLAGKATCCEMHAHLDAPA